jgi:hypothetical protein
LGEACNHIAALLFAVEDYVNNHIKNTDKDSISCTSRPCEWNRPRKRKLSPKKIDDVRPIKHQYGKKPRLNAIPTIGVYKACATVKNTYLDKVLDKLKVINPNSVLITTVPKQKTDDRSSIDNIIGAYEEVTTSEFDIEECSKNYIPISLLKYQLTLHLICLKMKLTIVCLH